MIGGSAGVAAPRERGPAAATVPLNLLEAVSELEKRLLFEALEKGRHNQRKAAELLGLTYDQFRGLYRKYAPAATLAPLHYLELPMAVLLGYLIFGDFPNALTWAGIAIIVASGLYVIHRERVTQHQARAVLPPEI